MNKSILLIVEGARAECRFFSKILKIYRDLPESNIFSYNTTIHEMINSFTDENGLFDDELDTIGVLRESKLHNDKEVLNNKFTDIFLVFDMDPQDQRYDSKKIDAALSFFNDPTDKGKLFINYPMFESYRHIPSLDDDCFLTITVHKNEIREYKRISSLSKNCCKELQHPEKINRQICDRILILNLKKINYILRNDKTMPSLQTYLSNSNLREINRLQSDKFESEGILFVLNTSVLCIVDYNPTRFFEQLDVSTT